MFWQKANLYQPWKVEEKDFPDRGSQNERIKFLLNYGILAPSSHNVQPWAFKVGADYLEIYADQSRRLKESDKEGRMLFVAMGCLIANLKIAASYFSLDYDVKYYSIDLFSNQKLALTAKMIFSGDRAAVKTADDKTSGQFSAITRRCSNRNKYKNQSVPTPNIKELENLNKDKSLKIVFAVNSELRSKIAEVSSRAMGQVMSDRDFRRELAFWLRGNWTLKRDGMPGNGHCMSLPLSFIAPFVLRNVDVSKVEAEKERRRILNFPAVGIISSRENNLESWLKAGELLEAVLLTARSMGIDSVIRVASIEFPETREALGALLGIGSFTPQMLFGLGYAEPAPHSPRRGIKEMTIA